MTDGTDRDSMVQRRSLGGHVVEAGLAAVGFDASANNDVALVETARPHRSPYRIVLAQNAWNVVDNATFWSLLRQYPASRRLRYIVRRIIAQINLRRAKKVVCLTDSMRALCARYSSNVVSSPVTVPFDFLSQPVPERDPEWSNTVLVPGTVTWHKNPAEAIRVVKSLRSEGRSINRIVFAGSDDGSGCWQAVELAALSARVDVKRATLGREEMAVACVSSLAVVIPSQLESLSLSLAEALLFSPTVIASDLPVHREVSERIGRDPLWLNADGLFEGGIEPPVLKMQSEVFFKEWKCLGDHLELPRLAKSSKRHVR